MKALRPKKCRKAFVLWCRYSSKHVWDGSVVKRLEPIA